MRVTEADIEVIMERAKELHPEAKPRIISDNGPQFIAKDFKEFIRISGMTLRQNFALLSPIERKNRTLAQIAQRRVHPAANPISTRRHQFWHELRSVEEVAPQGELPRGELFPDLHRGATVRARPTRLSWCRRRR